MTTIQDIQKKFDEKFTIRECAIDGWFTIGGDEQIKSFITDSFRQFIEGEIERLKEDRKIEGITSVDESEYEYQRRNAQCIGFNKAIQDQITHYRTLLEDINN